VHNGSFFLKKKKRFFSFFIFFHFQKINQKNAWSLNLIEHIDDVLEADERAAAGRSELVTTNFQKASCTVETSVKIYCYRVDAVHSETFKMLGGLTRAEADAESDASDDDGDDARGAGSGDGAAGENGEQQFDEDGNPIAKVKKIAKRGRKDGRQAGAATLESNRESLDLKAGAETVLSVDPLFRKTSAKFDQGGTRGLLLNHLQVAPSMQLLFDSAMPIVQPAPAVAQQPSPATTDEDDEGDFDDAQLGSLLSMAAVRANATLCPSFDNWSWDAADAGTAAAAAATAASTKAKSAASKAGKDVQTNDGGLFGKWDAAAADIADGADDSMRKIEFGGADFDDGGFGGAGDYDGGADDEPPLLHATEYDNDGQSIAAAIVLRPDQQQQQQQQQQQTGSPMNAAFLAAGASAGPTSGMAFVANMLGQSEQQNDYQFFDASLLKNWAGPAHWKFSKVPAATRSSVAAAAAAAAAGDEGGKSQAALAMGVGNNNDGDDDANDSDNEGAASSKRKRSRATKSKTMIDFTNPPDVDFEKAFKTVPVAQTTLTATMRARLAEQPTVLPPDLHFDVRSLTALFNKPKWSVVPVEKRRRLSTAPVDDIDNGVGGAAERDAAALLGEARFADYDDDAEGGFGDGGFEGAELDAAGEGVTLAAVAAPLAGLSLVASPLKPQKMTIGFERKAKRVDVRLLKRSIWQELSRKAGEDPSHDDIDDDNKKGGGDDDDDHDDKGRAVADDVRTGAATRVMEEPRDFRAILDVIPSRPDAGKVGEISVSLSFICLLHLCNEKRLLLEPSNGSLIVRPPT
jgi:condensin complex subunit 2